MRRLGWIKWLSVAFVGLALGGCGGGGGDDDDGGGGNGPFTVGGTISGLSGTVVLRLNGANDLPVASQTSFQFPTSLTNGTNYTVTILSQPATQVCGPTVTNDTGTINGANVTNVQIDCSNYSIGGTVTGLKADMTLVVNNSVEIPVLANATTFTSPPGMSLGAVGILYNVSIKTQPADQTCTIIRTTGIVVFGAADVSGATGPSVDCVDNVTDAFTGTYVIEGDEDDEGFGVVTFNADGSYLLGVRNDEPMSASDVCAGKSGVQYGIYDWDQASQVLRIVKHAPIGLGDDCGLDVGTAVTVSPNVGDDDGELTLIEVGSNPPVGAGRLIPVESTPGTLIGSWGGPQAFAVFTSDNKFFLATTRWIVQNAAHFPGIEHGCYSLSSGTTAAGSFTFNVGSGCTVNGTLAPVDSTGASGFSALTAPRDFTVNGDVIQAAAGGGSVTPLTGTAPRILPTQLPTTYSISAGITGLSASGLILQVNGKNGPPVDMSAGSATIATGVKSGTAYIATVQQQPAGLYCTVTDGTGVAFANVTNVAVSCAAITGETYTVSGTVNNLTGAGLALRLNGETDPNYNVSPAAGNPANYGFAAGLQMGTPFSVTVLSQPASPTQFCFVPAPAGTINASDVAVNVNCVNSVASIVSGNVSGLAAGQSLQLRLNYADAAGVPAAPVNGAVNANGSFNVFSGTPVPANGTFDLGIVAQPVGQTCTVTRSRGIAIANVANASIACVDNPTSALTGTYSALNPEGGGRLYVNFNADGTYTTAMIHNDWACGLPRNGNGVEYGVFRWNPTTGEFQQPVPAVIDTNDGCGLSDPDDPFVGYITRAGNAIEIRETQNGPLLISAPAVQSNPGTLVGAWVREAGNGQLLVFDADGFFLHVETQTFFPNLPNQLDPTVLNGQERGCYTASAPASGTITVTIDAGCRPDDLASYDLSFGGGLLGFPVVKTSSYSFNLAGDTLTFNGIVFKRTQPN